MQLVVMLRIHTWNRKEIEGHRDINRFLAIGLFWTLRSFDKGVCGEKFSFD